MGLFGNPRKNKDKWAELVVANTQPGMDLDEKFGAYIVDAGKKMDDLNAGGISINCS